MKDDIRDLTNPACHQVQYKSQVLSFLPVLTVLDGMLPEWTGTKKMHTLAPTQYLLLTKVQV